MSKELLKIENLHAWYGESHILHGVNLTVNEGEVVTLQDLLVYEILGEDKNGKIQGRHKPTGIRPSFWDKAKYYGLESTLAEALNEGA